MKTIVLLLLTPLLGFVCLAQAARPINPKPNVKTVYNTSLFTLATKELAGPYLRKVYGKALQVSKVSRNMHDASVRDTLLSTTTGADKLQLFTNQYNTFLLKAEITSRKLTFGKGLRVGVAKPVFCKSFNLPTTFNEYCLTDGEGRGSIYFFFSQGVLTKVRYTVGWVD